MIECPPASLSRRRFLAAAAASSGGAPLAAGQAQLAKATQALQAAIDRAEQDPERPVYHFRPPAQWMNDPNGTIYYRGWHHLFYQLNPFGAEWNHMHWGHARSRDLVNWEHLPIALGPSREKGEEHVFSGGAVPGPDGRPRLFYTSIGRRDPEQWMAIPEDEELVHWRKYERNPVLTLAVHGGVRVAEWRDPFLFTAGGTTFMVCGGNRLARGGAAAVQLYEAADAGAGVHRVARAQVKFGATAPR